MRRFDLQEEDGEIQEPLVPESKGKLWLKREYGKNQV